MMSFHYQRLIVAYHGCDAKVRDSVLRGGTLKSSANEYDWLGHGIYFWEHGPRRALNWAEQQQKRGKLSKPAVLGAVLHSGQCFDLLDTRYTDVLHVSFSDFCEATEGENNPIPSNAPLGAHDPDRLLRRLDCAVINWTIDQIEARTDAKFLSVRGVFQEGEPAFPESGIRRRSHIQIAVRDPACITGYFLPTW